MTSPITQAEASSDSHGLSLPTPKLKRSNSSSSLNSVLSLVEGVHQIDTGLRVCKDCLRVRIFVTCAPNLSCLTIKQIF